MLALPSLRSVFFALLCAGGLAIAAASPAAAFSPTERSEIEAIIKDYLLRNPEVLRDAILELQRRSDAAETKRRTDALQAHAKLIYESPRGVVIGNPAGDVAVVEFFDYNCGFCRRALADMMDLLKTDPKLKFIMKEFPILGPASVDAARVSVAVRMQDKDGNLYLDFHRRLLASRGEANRERALAAARDSGANMARIEKDMQSEEVNATLQESMVLADALGISGTPSYIIADEVIPGAVGFEALKRRIDSVRKCGQAMC